MVHCTLTSVLCAMLDGQACDARHVCLAISTPLEVSVRVIRCTSSFCLCAPGDACAQINYCMLAFCWPLFGPFCFLLPCVALPNFWNNAHFAPSVWPRVGVNDAQMCPPAVSYLTCSCITGLAPRCSQCLLELCSAITFNCRIGSSLSVLLGWGMVSRLCLVGLFGGLSRCVFGFFSWFCSFHQHLFLSVSPVSLSMIVQSFS